MAFPPLTYLLNPGRRITAAFGCLASVFFAMDPLDAAELIMVEQPGCAWCARWDAEIAPIYPKTHEGKFAPLRRADLRNMPVKLKLSRRVTFTPTFLIVEDGHEMARLEGYPGEDFFWPLISGLLHEHVGFEAPPPPAKGTPPAANTTPIGTND
ncbi:hypothetical protein [Phaeobacter sp. C3_T13_0]|uniref:hypothetical protein n=1 Tax=Phaeobacter cretensis TaxID=3342641 RepID=UPI0039BC39CE